MNKSLIILALTLMQCACATQEPMRSTGPTLPSFDAISAEITIGYEKTDAEDELTQAVALNREKQGPHY